MGGGYERLAGVGSLLQFGAGSDVVLVVPSADGGHQAAGIAEIPGPPDYRGEDVSVRIAVIASATSGSDGSLLTARSNARPAPGKLRVRRSRSCDSSDSRS